MYTRVCYVCLCARAFRRNKAGLTPDEPPQPRRFVRIVRVVTSNRTINTIDGRDEFVAFPIVDRDFLSIVFTFRSPTRGHEY